MIPVTPTTVLSPDVESVVDAHQFRTIPRRTPSKRLSDTSLIVGGVTFPPRDNRNLHVRLNQYTDGSGAIS